MVKKIVFTIVSLFCVIVCLSVTQASIAPNYGAYTLNPEYTGEPLVLGWAEQRIEEKLGRGIVAVPIGQGRIYLGWRLLNTVKPSLAGGSGTPSDCHSPVEARI